MRCEMSIFILRWHVGDIVWHVRRVLDWIDLVQIFLLPRIDMVCIHFVFISEKESLGASLCLFTRIPSLRENSVISEGIRGVGGATSRRVGRRASSARRSIRCGSSGADAKEDEGDRTRVC